MKQITPIRTIHNQAKVAHIYLYGDIVSTAMYDNDVSPTRVQEMLNKATTNEVVVHISSCGGDAYAGIAIYNILKECGKKITTQIDSIGASSASIIAMAGDEIVFAKGAQIMIHNPFTMCWGDAKEFGKVIDGLNTCKASIIDIYSTHAIEGVDYSALMDAETWADASRAKTIFADVKSNDVALTEETITNRFSNIINQFNSQPK